MLETDQNLSGEFHWHDHSGYTRRVQTRLNRQAALNLHARLPRQGHHTGTARLEIRNLKADAVWDHENGFYWFSDPSRLNKALAHHELYRSIVNLPGHVFELGVYKGASLIRMATFRAALEHESSRRIVGFDAYGSFPTQHLSDDEDHAFVERFSAAGGDGLSKQELQSILERKRFSNFELVEGDVFDTLPQYLQTHPETRLALLHLDMDVKEPTSFALEQLYERVVPGGLVVFDDYNTVAGETEAVDEFIGQRGLRLEKLPWYSIPAFVRKPA